MLASPRPSVLNSFPHPIAFPYSLAHRHETSPSEACWLICLTAYQVLRVICLPLVSQSLREPIDQHRMDPSARNAVHSLNRAIAAIRSPCFSDWITLVNTLRRRLPALDIEPFFPELSAALAGLQAEHPQAWAQLRAFRNDLAHWHAATTVQGSDTLDLQRQLERHGAVLDRVCVGSIQTTSGSYVRIPRPGQQALGGYKRCVEPTRPQPVIATSLTFGPRPSRSPQPLWPVVTARCRSIHCSIHRRGPMRSICTTDIRDDG